VISRVSVSLTGAILLAAGALLLSEHRAMSPGDLAPAHADLDLSCRACHVPLRGAGTGCVRCHGSLPAVNKHAETGIACASCHREHGGAAEALTVHAGDDCMSCHAHDSIQGVAKHQLEVIDRPTPPEAPSKEHVEAALDFSHREHFGEIADQKLPGDSHDCGRCHRVGTVSGKDEPKSEQAIVWSGCQDCHESWAEAGFPQAAPRAEVVSFEAARWFRIRFRHSTGHLQAPCRDCHVGIDDAEAPRKHRGGDPSPAAKTRNCFGCHAHQPTTSVRAVLPMRGTAHAMEDARVQVVACTACHEFHGMSSHGDFPAGPSDRSPPAPWDVWGRIAGFALTPWLVAFLGMGTLGLVVAVRRLPTARSETEEADPDVAPQRGSEVPVVSPTYESSIASLFIVGELAGVPLINRAMKSGFDAIDFIANRLQVDGRSGGSDVLDVVIAGSGPGGLGAATRAKSLGLSYVLCEKTSAAATIKSYPRAKIVQSAPIDIPEYGTFFQENDESKEGLVRRWEDIVARTGVVVNEREEVLGITRGDDGMLVTEAQGGKRYRSRFAVLGIGVRGTPRRLGLPGEVPERVTYALIDAADYRERRMLVVGGGNAACEAALALADPTLLNQVTLSHRGPVLKGVTPQNSQAVDTAAREGQLEVVPDSALEEIRAQSALLKTPTGPREIPNDIIIAMIGADLPTKFLRKIGVKIVKKGGL
jgi:thioredoxin reductase